ncbi:MAG: tRNA 4-thiouridine(8) synthase ThiI [Candidatus Omnitrophota bacterium]
MSLKAIALISGGLDSALAAKVIMLQRIDVAGFAFTTPFTHPQVERLGQSLGIEVRAIDISPEYLDVVKNPRFGFGNTMNPCIDCHIFMLKKARELADEYKAYFIITGEVLGQRPMSQNKSALGKIEKESGLEGLLLRPLSARLLAPTIPEQRGWVDRDKLFDFSGRSRKPQIELAKQLGLEGFGQPAGGCLLTDPGFSRRLKDLIAHQQDFNLSDVQLLKIGRHFRLSGRAKLILGRNRIENQRLAPLVKSGDIHLEPVGSPGPAGILRSKDACPELLELSAGILARYCDHNSEQVSVSIGDERESRVIRCFPAKPEDLDALRI